MHPEYAMTPSQVKRFKKICKDMAALIDELHSSGSPDATLFLEDGFPAIYDWPGEIDRRPDDALVEGCYWHKSGGGGK
jgi:hypothetical protein